MRAVRYQSHYATGVPIDAADSNYGVLFMLLASLVRLTDGEDRVPAALASLNALQPAIDRAHERYAPLFADFAPRFARKNAIYTMASGACYCAAYSFAICVLMEMFRIGSQAVHATSFSTARSRSSIARPRSFSSSASARPAARPTGAFVPRPISARLRTSSPSTRDLDLSASTRRSSPI